MTLKSTHAVRSKVVTADMAPSRTPGACGRWVERVGAS